MIETKIRYIVLEIINMVILNGENLSPNFIDNNFLSLKMLKNDNLILHFSTRHLINL
jgi:hypothetical protein